MQNSTEISKRWNLLTCIDDLHISFYMKNNMIMNFIYTLFSHLKMVPKLLNYVEA